jgi:hypothetical protein
MLNYCKIEEKDNMYKCCDFPPPPHNKKTGDCCYDNWSTDLSKITNELRSATTRAAYKQKEYNYITDWYNTLETWFTDWESADRKVDILCRNLDLFIKHLDRICAITDKTVKAIDILFCMIEDLYFRVDCLKEKWDELNKCIACLKSPDLTPDKGIVACLKAYGTKLDAVIATRDLVITKVISAIEYAYDLHDFICDQYGLKKTLIYWKELLGRKGQTATPELSPEEKSKIERCSIEPVPLQHCELIPVMTFPIHKDHYYLELKAHAEKVKIKMDDLEKDSDKANERKAALQACQDGLNKAMTAAGPSVKCN